MHVLRYIFFLFPLYVLGNSDSNKGKETFTNTSHIPLEVTTTYNRSEFQDSITVSEEKKLVQFLMHKYEIVGRRGRPVVKDSDPVAIEFGLGLIQMELDEKRKILVTTMWARYKWIDEYLKWHPVTYGGVTSVRLNSGDIWLPDIVHFNTADVETLSRDSFLIILPDGSVTWVPQTVYKTSCNVNIRDFPFDQQRCTMWFGSWTHPLSHIDINFAFAGGIDLSTFQSDYKDSCEWEIVKHSAERELLPENDPNPIVVLSIELHLKRKLTFSTYILTLPCVFLALLTLVVFWLPPNGPDRTGLAMSLFASFLVLLLILVEAALPTASSVPKLGVYYCFNMVLIILSIFLSSVVANIHEGGKNKRPVPIWLRVITIDFLGRLFCLNWNMKNRKKRQRNQDSLFGEEDKMEMVGNAQELSNNRGLKLQGAIDMRDTEVPINETNINYSPKNSPGMSKRIGAVGEILEVTKIIAKRFDALSRQLCEVRDVLDVMKTIKEAEAQKEKDIEEGNLIMAEWNLAARCLDRFFFVVYFFSIILSLYYMFPTPT